MFGWLVGVIGITVRHVAFARSTKLHRSSPGQEARGDCAGCGGSLATFLVLSRCRPNAARRDPFPR